MICLISAYDVESKYYKFAVYISICLCIGKPSVACRDHGAKRRVFMKRIGSFLVLTALLFVLIFDGFAGFAQGTATQQIEETDIVINAALSGGNITYTNQDENEHETNTFQVTSTVTITGLIPDKKYTLTSNIHSATSAPGGALSIGSDILDAPQTADFTADTEGKWTGSVTFPSHTYRDYPDDDNYTYFVVVHTVKSNNEISFSTGSKYHQNTSPMSTTYISTKKDVFYVKKEKEYTDPGNTGSTPTKSVLKGSVEIDTEVGIQTAGTGDSTYNSDEVWVLTPNPANITADGKVNLKVTDKITLKGFPTTDTNTDPYTGTFIGSLLYEVSSQIMEVKGGNVTLKITKTPNETFLYTNSHRPDDTSKTINFGTVSLEVGKTYVVYQELTLQSSDDIEGKYATGAMESQGDDTIDYDVDTIGYDVEKSDQDVRNVKHWDPNAKTQMFRIEDTRMPKDSIKISTAVQRTQGSSVQKGGSPLKIESDKNKGAEVQISGLEDVVTIEGLLYRKNYTLITRVYDMGGTLIKELTKDINVSYEGDTAKVKIDLSSISFKAGTSYYVSQEIKSNEQLVLKDASNQTLKEIHTGAHNGKNITSQQFEITALDSTPNPAPNPSNVNPGNTDSTDPTDSSSEKVEDTTEPTTTPTSSATADTSTTTATETTTASAVSTDSSTESSSTSTTESPIDLTDRIPAGVVTTNPASATSEAEISATTEPTTLPATTRTFEFIEIFEDIPLGVKTTAPIDFEEILIEESIPLGGVPHTNLPQGGIPYAGLPQLPYTGLPINELYVGIGMLVIAIGIYIRKTR